MEAAVRIVGDVIGIIELVGSDVLMADAVLAREGFSVRFVGLGKRGRVRRDRNRLAAQDAVGGPGEVRRVSAARIGHDYAAHLLQRVEELALFLVHTSTVAANLPAARWLRFPESDWRRQ